eukprot:5166373-Alexandrium_andersonii.AAC.1
MSASLVGSEMCIRDSSLRRLAAPSRCRALAPPPPPDAALHALARPRSVSYTHLTLPTICSV